MTVNRTYSDPSEAGSMDLDTGGVLTETIWDALLSNQKNGGCSTDGGKSRVTTQFDKTDTTLANVTGLSLAVEAGGVYAFRAVLFTTCAAAGGAKVAIAGTATATTVRYHGIGDVGNGTLFGGTQQTALGGAAVTQTSAVTFLIIEGLITVNAAGTLTVQFAQNVTSGTSSVLVGSTFEVKVHA